MNRKLSLGALLLLLIFKIALAAPTAETHAKLVLPENPLPFGKSAELVITLSWPVAKDLEPPKAETLEIPGATNLDQYEIDLGSDGDKRQVEYHLIFTRLEPGEFDVGPVLLKTTGGEVQTKALQMTFAGATPKDGDKPGEIRAVKPVVELSTGEFWRKLLSWSLAALAIVLLLAAIVNQFGLLDRFRSPKARAINGLKKLKKTKSKPGVVLIRSVEILRKYLHEAYSISTREATSLEILRQITMDNRCTSMKDTSEQILTKADMVKFANKSVSNNEAEDLLENLLNTIKEEKKVSPR